LRFCSSHGCLFAASAQEDKKIDEDKPADPDTGESTVEEKTLGILPNPLAKYGVKFAATYIGELLGNVSGGLKQGAIYEGRLNLAVDVDLQKLAGLNQLTFHANMFQIHGDGLSQNNLQNFFVVSGIEALPTTRLYEAYFERKWGSNIVSLKVASLPPIPSSSTPNTPTFLPTHRWAGQRSPLLTYRAVGRRRRSRLSEHDCS
jgi:porin